MAAPGPTGSPSTVADRFLRSAVHQLLPSFLQPAPAASTTSRNQDERKHAIVAAGREMAEYCRHAGLGLAVCLAAQQRVRNGLIRQACRTISAADLAAAITELLHFSDWILTGLVDEWSRLKAQNHRRRHQEARRYILREKKRYATIFRRMEEPAFVVDRELCLLDVNPAFEKFFNLRAKDCLGTTCMTSIGHRFCEQCPLSQVIREGGSFSGLEVKLEIVGPGQSGEMERRTVLMAGTALGEVGDGDLGAIVVLQNITEQKKAEAELRRSEEKFRSLVENLPDVIWRADQRGRVLYVSSNSKSILGLDAEEISGSDRFARVHPEDLPELQRVYGQLFEKAHSYDVRYRYRHGNGSWIWLRERAAATGQGLPEETFVDGLSWEITEFVNVEGELEEYRSWLEDMVDERTEELSRINRKLKKEIGKRSRVEKELIRLTASLKQSNAELEQFAYVASHDLKEPLMLITAFAERLQLRYTDELDERGRDYVGRIVKASRQLRELVEALLQLSRVTASHRPFQRLKLQELVREVLSDLDEGISRTGARVEVINLPELNGDVVQIRQLFQNLIANALKYRRQEVVPEVVISGRLVEEGFCEITITDNGIGLSADEVEKIFEPFVRLHDRGDLEGCGMGLTTCRKIVGRHGGEIKAVSRPGQGAVFVIRLPLRHQGHK